jgi:hypothetical protein
MPQPPQPSIREVLLQEIQAQSLAGSLQRDSVLNAAAQKLPGVNQQAILAQWYELFRTGLLAPSLNLRNPDPPFFHLTDTGRRALENATRDPSNPAGYLRHLALIAPLNNVAMSHLTEGLDCYVGGLFKAAAVMVGGAAESVILDLRDSTAQKLKTLNKPIPRPLEDWRIKTVTDGLRDFLDEQKAHFSRDLRDEFEAYWSAFALQIRAARNDAGHPASIAPVTPDKVHASLLIFTGLARLANNLADQFFRLRGIEGALVTLSKA